MPFFRSLIALLLLSPLLPAQEPPPEGAPEDLVFRTGVSVVTVPTIVTDKDGSYIAGLRPQDFQLTDNGKAQDIKVDVSYVPISLVVVVQANSAMTSILPKIQKIGPLFQNLVVGEQGEVAVIAFDHRIQVKQDFTTDINKIDEAFKGIREGSTSSRMIDAVIDATRMLRKRPENRRRIILLISETRDGGSQARPREALYMQQFANVTMYTVNVNRLMTTLTKKAQPPRPDPIPPGGRHMPGGVPLTATYGDLVGNNYSSVIPLVVEIFKQVKAIFVDNPVEVFTKWTGGSERSFLTQRDLEAAIAQVGQELHAQYLITYTPNNREEGGFHEIKVLVNRPELGEMRTKTRPGYWVAAKPS